MNESSKTAQWAAIEFVTSPPAVDAVEFACDQLDAIGSSVEIWQKDAERVAVTGYFDTLPEADALDHALNDALAIYGLDRSIIGSINRSTIQDTDWLAEWKKYWKASDVGRFIIAPPWDVPADPDKIIITIEPNMAFGTGTHDTTQLCLKAMGDLVGDGDSVLDVGTGTGILSIAAAKLGAGPILACDTDPDSIAIAKVNAVANGVGPQITFETGSLEADCPAFDVVVANLTLDVIQPMLPLLVSKAGRTLLLSGILQEQTESIQYSLSAFDLPSVDIERSGEWIAVIAKVS